MSAAVLLFARPAPATSTRLLSPDLRRMLERLDGEQLQLVELLLLSHEPVRVPPGQASGLDRLCQRLERASADSVAIAAAAAAAFVRGVPDASTPTSRRAGQ